MMTEMARTALFVAAAALSLIVAFAFNPSDDPQNMEELLGTRLNEFEVDVAKRLKIVKFDQETASTREFEVAESEGLWTIPSKQDYPADAARQMGEAVTCLIDREVLRVAGKSAMSHEELGVIDPSTSKLDSKAEGVGIRVTITDSNDTALADMIIGKAVKEVEGQHYVRNANQDVVYVVNLDPEKLSTKFEDWIEEDLLKLNPQDIRRINIKDYSAELQPRLTAGGFQMQVNWDRRGEMTLRYDQSESKWIAERLQQRPPKETELVDFELTNDEQLNEDALGELRTALDDLLLVDVERKPSGLSADLKAGSDFLKNQEAGINLMERGFAPLSLTPDTPPEILSSEGEIICTLQDGVEYVLRFGNLQISKEGEAKDSENASDAKSDAEQTSSDDGINRYLFVMARFNESILEKPELAELPELPEIEDANGETDTEDANGETDIKDASESKESDPGESASTAETSKDAEEQRAALLGARKLIEKENERRLNEYQENLEAGQQRVSELNKRFADWYYVISNDVYKKIHLSRNQVISKKENEAEAATGTGAPAGGLPGLPNLPFGGSN